MIMPHSEQDIEKEWVDVVCPRCGVIYARPVEVGFIESPDAQRHQGYLAIICDECRHHPLAPIRRRA